MACDRLQLASVADPSALVEGAWLLATVDGEAEHEEVLALALLMDQLEPEQRKVLELDRALGDDEEAWFETLALLPPEMHEPLLDTLCLVAATDKQLAASERRFLRRVGKALGRDIDVARVERICGHLSRGETLPPDFLTARRSP
jgi:tellurite resistance protein